MNNNGDYTIEWKIILKKEKKMIIKRKELTPKWGRRRQFFCDSFSHAFFCNLFYQ